MEISDMLFLLNANALTLWHHRAASMTEAFFHTGLGDRQTRCSSFFFNLYLWVRANLGAS